MNAYPSRSELHRVVFAGLQQSPVDKAAASFMALAPEDRAAFVEKVNRIFDGQATLRFDQEPAA